MYYIRIPCPPPGALRDGLYSTGKASEPQRGKPLAQGYKANRKEGQEPDSEHVIPKLSFCLFTS